MTLSNFPNGITVGSAFIGGDVNRTKFDQDGSVSFEGDATVWEDLNFSVESSGGPAATTPNDVVINGVFYKEFDSGNNQNCGSGQEIPHKAKLGNKLHPHIHLFLKAGESVGTTGVTFTVNWELRQVSGVTHGSVDLSATSAQLNTVAGASKLDIYDSTGFVGPTELGAQISLKIERTAGNAGDIIVTTYGVHYEIDAVGSKQVTVK